MIKDFVYIYYYLCFTIHGATYDNYIWTNIATIGSKSSYIKIKIHPFYIGASDYCY